MLKSLFNSEYCKIFKSTYFREHLPCAVSEDVSMKLRKIKTVDKEFDPILKKQDFSTSASKTSENVFLFVFIS